MTADLVGYTTLVDMSEGTLLQERYRLQRLLGRGGTAEVWAGDDERLRRPVAVKLLRSDLRSRPEVRARLSREARAAAGLHHPAIVRLFDAGEVDGVPFLVMECLPGETLADRYRAGVDDSWLMASAVTIADALGCAHANGIVHRDVKPGNILIGPGGDVRLGDFGIATSGEIAGDPTTSGLVLGTPAYLAPERIEGGPGTPASDIYALGVVLYEGFAGRRPFPGQNPVAVARAVLDDPPMPLAEARPDLPPALSAAVDRALARDPRDRHESADALSVELREAAEAAGVLLPGGQRESADDGDVTAAVPVAQTQVLPAVAPLVLLEGWGQRVAGRRSSVRWAVLGAAALGLAVLLAVAGLVAMAGDTTEPVDPAEAQPVQTVEPPADESPADDEDDADDAEDEAEAEAAEDDGGGKGNGKGKDKRD